MIKIGLTPEEIGNLEWTETPNSQENYAADFTFVDDYPKECQVIASTASRETLKSMVDDMTLAFSNGNNDKEQLENIYELFQYLVFLAEGEK